MREKRQAEWQKVAQRHSKQDRAKWLKCAFCVASRQEPGQAGGDGSNRREVEEAMWRGGTLTLCNDSFVNYT